MTALGTYTPDNLLAGAKRVIGEDVLIQSGLSLVRGTVLGQVKTSTPTTGVIAGTGNGTMTAVSGGAKTKRGNYVATCIEVVAHGGIFEVKNPDGIILGQVSILGGAGGTGVFTSDEINFTLTDGATDFAAGDTGTIAVADGVPATVVVTGTGNGTLTLVEGRRNTKVGAYVLSCIAAVAHGGTFKLVDPDGHNVIASIVIPAGAGNSIAFDCDQLAGLITDGSTDFIVGDLFTITVSIDPRQCIAVNSAATNGASVPYAILSEDVDASAAAVRSIGYLEGSFNERALIFGGTDTIATHREAMRDLGMITVPSVPAGA